MKFARPIDLSGQGNARANASPAGVHAPGEDHSSRAHAKLSASGASRWMNCPGSVKLSEGLPDYSSPAAQEGTRCHEVLERILRGKEYLDLKPDFTMVMHAESAARFIKNAHRLSGGELLVETKTSLEFLHPHAFGTLDAAIIDHFGTLNIIDFKYGSHTVSPRENLQLLFYAIGVANEYQWNFKTVRLTIIQPRSRGYDAPVFWETGAYRMRLFWVPIFQDAFKRVEEEPETYKEGEWCFFCKARKICPLKQNQKLEKISKTFTNIPF